MRFCRSAAPTLNTLTRTQGRCGLIVLTSVRLLPIPSRSDPFAPYVLSPSRRWPYLMWFSTHRFVRITLNMLIPPLERRMLTAPKNARQLTLRASKHNTHNHGKVPTLFFTLPSVRLINPLATATCSYPSCTLPATLYPEGSGWNYCGQSHE